MTCVRYTSPVPRDGGEHYDFELMNGSQEILVRVTREAIEEFVSARGVPEPTCNADRLHFLEVYQPEFKQLALDKLLPGETFALITGTDITDSRA